MQKRFTAKTRKGVLLSLFVLGLVAALIVLPYQFSSEAGSKGNLKKGLFERTASHEDGIDWYDIREDKSDETVQAVLGFRQTASRSASTIADVREKFVQGEDQLRTQVPNLKIEYNNDIRTPEVIATDVWKSKIDFLTRPSETGRVDILRGFMKQNEELVGVSNRQTDALKVTADYTNPNGDLSYVMMEQFINNVPVFRGEIKAGFTRQNEMVRVINNLAPGLDYGSLSTDFRDPLNAVRAAAGYINYELLSPDVTRNNAESTDLRVVYGSGYNATTAEKMYFPTEPGVAIPAWRVLIWQPQRAYYVIVDAENGRMLWRKNITDDQATSATYQVYVNPLAMINVADSPAPLTPGPVVIGGNAQGAIIPSRTSMTLIGNEAPYAFNNLGWITDGTNFTDGNNVQAGIDRVAPTGVDAPQDGDSACPGAGCRVFTSTWNPPPGNPAPGDDPLTVQAQRGAVIQMFYVMNRYHDEMYRLGFNEAAKNFQNDNFGRNPTGGTANAIAGVDRVSAEGQDSSGTNNANFSTPADGGRGVMQMYLWTGPTPDKDGTTDADVIIHEVTHGTSNRLHGNGSGLGGMGGMMGEGWSDWYAHVLLSQESDPANGIYTTGGYATHLLGGFTDNYYYGIRRFPKALLAFTGGPNRPACGDAPCPHNPFTFKHINTNCDTTLGTTTTPVSSAFPRSPVIATSGSCNQVHNAGEIWSSLLWEVRGLMITRLGWTVGNRKVIQLVTDGMKLAPLNPNFVQERDAIIAAAAASAASPEASADVFDVREGFRRRGMGFSASVQSTAAVTEAFDFPNARLADTGFSVSDSTGDGDGFPEPGENVLLTVPVINPSTGGTINNVTASVTGGGSANYGNIADGATVVRQIAYTVPGGAACGSLHNVTITVSSDVGAQTPQIRTFRLGAPVGGAPVTFTNSTPVVIPGTGTGPGVSAPYGTTVTTSGLTGNKLIRLELTGISHTFPGDIDILLVGPGGQKFIVMSDAANTADAVNVNTQLVDSAAAIIPSADSPIAGEWRPTNHTAGDTFTAPAPAAPYLSPAPIGTETFATAFGTAGSAMNGTWTLYVMDDAGVDVGEMDGWKLTFESNDYVCSLNTVPDARADFDGDGKTDLSVFRPSEGNWYLNRSTDGFAVLTWGIASDTLAPGDYDGDGKTDVAVFRPSNTLGVTDWYILKSSDFTLQGAEWGIVGDTRVGGDFDGDNKSDIAVWRGSEGKWYILNSSGAPANTIEPFGLTGDIPVSMDSDNDGRTNLAVFRPGSNTWYVARNSGTPATNFDAFPFGAAGDKLVPADYNNDNKTDIAVYRPSTGQWIIQNSGGATTFTTFGNSTDIPVPGDYDGDGADDIAVYRSGTWYVLRSTSGLLIQAFGVGSDTAIPKAYIP
jgi:subtilisin-like proprotein convertase family protein